MPEAKIRSFLPSGSNARMSARRFSLLVVADVRPRADRDEEGLAVLREFEVARPVAAAADPLVAAGDVLDDRLGAPAGLGVAVLVGEADDRVGVADVDVLRLRPRRIERDPERAAQAGGEDLVDLGLAVAVGVAQDVDAVGAALGDEEVAVGGADDDAGLARAGGELGDLETLGACGQAPSGRGTTLGKVVGRRRLDRASPGRRA